MPVYEYACIECDKNIEITRAFNDEEKIPPCSVCGYSMVRVYNAPGVQFKGSGFYKTDNR
jgi:putative FmdB family regulatory protein